MIEEAIIMGSVALTGAMFMRLVGLRGWGLLPIGFLSGVVLFSLMICLQMLLDLPVSYLLPVIALPVTMLGALLLNLRPHINLRHIPSRTYLILVIAALCLTLLLIFWNLNIVVFATDTLRQSLASSLIASGNAEYMSSNLVIKRLNAVSLLDALGFLYNSPHLRTLPILISAGTAGTIAWAIYQLLKQKIRDSKQIVVASTMGVLIFISIYSVWWQSFYQGTHILYGGLLLLAVVSGWLLASQEKTIPARALVAIIITSIFGLMFSRPEAGILVPVALLPLLLYPSISTKIKQLIVGALGLSLLLQQGTILLLSHYTGSPLPKNALLLAIAGIVLLCFIFIVPWKFLKKRWLLVLWCIEILGWIALIAFSLYEPSIIWKSTVGTVKNVIFGQGLWGISYMLLLILFGFTILLEKRDRLDIILRYPITTLLPFGFLVGYLREGAYRMGVYDTFNRMLMHILPLLILYVVYRYYCSAKKRERMTRD